MKEVLVEAPPKTAYRHLTIDPEQNMLLCDTTLVGKDELVEVRTPDGETPPSACGRILRKLKDPNVYEVAVTYDGNEAMGRQYVIGPRAILRVVMKTLSGTRRRKCPLEEKMIVDLERGENFKERKVNRAKTGSVRKRRK